METRPGWAHSWNQPDVDPRLTRMSKPSGGSRLPAWVAGRSRDREAGSRAPDRILGISWKDAHNRFFLLLLGVGIIIFWLPRLPGSLWVDETTTAWVVDTSFGEMLDRAVEFQSMAPTYYVVAWAARGVGGTSEIALRMPSVLAMGLALYLLYRLGRRLFDSETGLLAAVVLATWNEGAHLATDARPYALGVLAFVAATLSLVRWFERGRNRDAVAYVVLAVLVVYVQYVLATALLAHAVYVWRRRGALPSHRSLAIGGAAFGLLLLPLLPPLLATLDQRDALSLGMQSAGATLFVIAPPALIVGMAAGIAFVAGRVRLESDAPVPQPAGLALVWVWAAAPPIILFLISWLMDADVLGPQHVTQSAPAIALLAACAIRRLGPPQVRRIILVLMVIVSLILGASHRQYTDDWRGAIHYSNGLVDASDPVLVRSGLVQSGHADWLLDADRAVLLLTPVEVYPTKGRPVVLPYGLSADERRYLEAEVVPIAEPASRFSVISLSSVGDPVLPWLQGRLRSAGFELRQRQTFGSVVVALFERV